MPWPVNCRITTFYLNTNDCVWLPFEAFPPIKKKKKKKSRFLHMTWPKMLHLKTRVNLKFNDGLKRKKEQMNRPTPTLHTNRMWHKFVHPIQCEAVRVWCDFCFSQTKAINVSCLKVDSSSSRNGRQHFISFARLQMNGGTYEKAIDESCLQLQCGRWPFQ